MATTVPDREQLEQIGLIADRVDNMLAAEQIPLPENIAKQGRVGALASIRDELRQLYIAVIGENPWEDHP